MGEREEHREDTPGKAVMDLFTFGVMAHMVVCNAVWNNFIKGEISEKS